MMSEKCRSLLTHHSIVCGCKCDSIIDPIGSLGICRECHHIVQEEQP